GAWTRSWSSPTAPESTAHRGRPHCRRLTAPPLTAPPTLRRTGQPQVSRSLRQATIPIGRGHHCLTDAAIRRAIQARRADVQGRSLGREAVAGGGHLAPHDHAAPVAHDDGEHELPRLHVLAPERLS